MKAINLFFRPYQYWPPSVSTRCFILLQRVKITVLVCNIMVDSLFKNSLNIFLLLSVL